MNLHRLILLILSICVAAMPLQAYERIPVTFTVVDTEDRPVANATIEASLPDSGNALAQTDLNGRATLHLSAIHTLSLEVSRPGYYATAGEIWRGGRYLDEDGRLVPRALPRAFEIVLKEIRHPVPLVHHSFRGHVPKVKGPVGFDLEAGDWTTPYGSGRREDLYLAFEDVHVQERAFGARLQITFPERDDGIKPFHAARPYSMEFGSNLAPPHVAPTEGYSPSFEKAIRYQRGDPLHTDASDERSFLFRIRTKRDASGTLIQACYGWIQGEIEFDPRDAKGIQLAFTYHLNADPSPQARSLEPLVERNR